MEERHGEVFSQLSEASKALLDERFANAALFFTKAIEKIKEYKPEVCLALVSSIASSSYIYVFVFFQYLTQIRELDFVVVKYAIGVTFIRMPTIRVRKKLWLFKDSRTCRSGSCTCTRSCPCRISTKAWTGSTRFSSSTPTSSFRSPFSVSVRLSSVYSSKLVDISQLHVVQSTMHFLLFCRFSEALDPLQKGLAFMDSVNIDYGCLTWPACKTPIEDSKPEDLRVSRAM